MTKPNVPPWPAYKFVIWINRKLESLKKKVMPTPMRIMTSLGGHYSVQVAYSGIKLNIFNFLYDNPQNIKVISKELKLDEQSLFRLLRAIVALGYIKKDNNGIYSLSKTGKALSDKGNLRHQAIMMGTEWYDGFSRLHKSVESGRKEMNEKFRHDFFEYIKQDSTLAKNFNGSMDDLTQACIPAILAEYDFSIHNCVVDIGGGNGQFLFSILEKYEDLKGVLFDMEAVPQPGSNALNGRYEFVTGDFFKNIPEGGDLYILKFILHDWSDENAMTILNNCRKSMKEGTKLILIEFLIEEDEKNMMRIYLDLLMMVMFEGKERDEPKLRDMLNTAGFRLNKVLKTRSFANVIEATAV